MKRGKWPPTLAGGYDREFPARPMLVGPVGITPIVSYYAENSPYQAFRWEASDALIMAMVEQQQAGIVLLRPTKQLTAQRVTYS